MKSIFLLFLFPLQLFSQDLSGIWVGTIATSGMQMPMELVINPDMTGYSMIISTFKGTENIAVKRTTLISKDGIITLSDDKLVYNNFVTRSRNVKAFCELSIKVVDNVMILSGPFHTRSRDLHADDKDLSSGTITLQKQTNQAHTKLIGKLDSLKLSYAVSFSNPEPVTKENGAIAEVPEKELPAAKIRSTIVSGTAQKTNTNLRDADLKPLERETPLVAEIPEKDLHYASVNKPVKFEPEKKNLYSYAPVSLPATKKNIILKVRAPVAMASATPVTNKTMVEPKKNVPVTAVSPPVVTTAGPAKKMDTVSVKPDKTIAAASVQKTAAVNEEKHQAVVAAPAIPVDPRVAGAAVEMAARKIEVIRSIDIKADSLVLILYDNGVVDGDTVSVVMNGKVIIPQQGLSEKAYRKVIHLTPDLGDSLQLVMYAETLGTIPPNTGLLIVEDGPDRQEIRFEGDMKKSSAVVLRRRR